MSAVEVESVQAELSSKLILDEKTDSDSKENLCEIGQAKNETNDANENSNKQKKKLNKLAGKVE